MLFIDIVFKCCISAAICLYFFGCLQQLPAPVTYGFADAPIVDPLTSKSITSSDPVWQVGELPEVPSPHVHAATLVETPAGVHAFWYAGTREGAKDVAIVSALLPANELQTDSMSWQPAQVLITRQQLQADLKRYIKKLGNPVAMVEPNGRLSLLFVSVSIGGWAGSAINVIHSTDNGLTWSRARRLVASPFLNISTLVKSPGFIWQDGQLGVTAYHEFIGKFSELLHINDSGQVVGKLRLSSGRHSIQPSLLQYNQQQADIYLRSAGAELLRIYQVSTQQGGQQWSSPEPMLLPNPNAAVATLVLPKEEGELERLLVFNRSETHRNVLTLAWAAGLQSDWHLLCDLEHGAIGARFSYPYMMQQRTGELHLVYTSARQRIRHIRFNQAWLDAHTGALSAQQAELPRCAALPLNRVNDDQLELQKRES